MFLVLYLRSILISERERARREGLKYEVKTAKKKILSQESFWQQWIVTGFGGDQTAYPDETFVDG